MLRLTKSTLTCNRKKDPSSVREKSHKQKSFNIAHSLGKPKRLPSHHILDVNVIVRATREKKRRERRELYLSCYLV